MTAQATIKCLPVNYPKTIMAKLLNSQTWAWEMILAQNAMQLMLPLKEPAEAEKDEMGWG